MDRGEVRRIVLETLETYTGLQNKAVQELKRRVPKGPETFPRRGRRRQSLVDMSVEILTEEGGALHVSDLVEKLRTRYGRLTDRDSVSSALAKKARSGVLFRQTAPATFDLLEPGEVKG